MRKLLLVGVALFGLSGVAHAQSQQEIMDSLTAGMNSFTRDDVRVKDRIAPAKTAVQRVIDSMPTMNADGSMTPGDGQTHMPFPIPSSSKFFTTETPLLVDGKTIEQLEIPGPAFDRTSGQSPIAQDQRGGWYATSYWRYGDIGMRCMYEDISVLVPFHDRDAVDGKGQYMRRVRMYHGCKAWTW
jgi:hypothetical protein